MPSIIITQKWLALCNYGPRDPKAQSHCHAKAGDKNPLIEFECSTLTDDLKHGFQTGDSGLELPVATQT